MNRAFARVAAICPLMAATTLLPVGAAGAAELAGHDGNACSVVGTVASATGLRYEPTGGSYVVDGVMDCTSKAFGHGTISGRGNGIVGCLGGTSQAVLDVAWRNGEHSELTMQTGDSHLRHRRPLRHRHPGRHDRQPRRHGLGAGGRRCRVRLRDRQCPVLRIRRRNRLPLRGCFTWPAVARRSTGARRLRRPSVLPARRRRSRYRVCIGDDDSATEAASGRAAVGQLS